MDGEINVLNLYDSKTKGFQIMSETKLIENGEKTPEMILRPRKTINVVV